jgi:hypothetical protein
MLAEDPPEVKYTVEILVPDKITPTPKQYVQELKELKIKGKQLARMKKEAVDCPVLETRVSFVQCFACPNFIRRVKGQVGCRGLPLSTPP